MRPKFLAPIMVPVDDYSAPHPQMEQPVFALPRKKNTEVWAVPLLLLPAKHDWAVTGEGNTGDSELVRVPLHSPSGGFNTPEARDVSMVAASMAFAMETMASLCERDPSMRDPNLSVAVQLILGSAIHQFDPGVLGPNTPAMFRFYVGMAFQVKA